LRQASPPGAGARWRIGLQETACRRVTHGTTSCRYDRRSREPTSRPAGDYLQSEPLRPGHLLKSASGPASNGASAAQQPSPKVCLEKLGTVARPLRASTAAGQRSPRSLGPTGLRPHPTSRCSTRSVSPTKGGRVAMQRAARACRAGTRQWVGRLDKGPVIRGYHPGESRHRRYALVAGRLVLGFVLIHPVGQVYVGDFDACAELPRGD